MAKGKTSSILRIIKGRVGNIIYRDDWFSDDPEDVIIQSYPDMSGITPSPAQLTWRSKFANAQAYGQTQKNNPIYIAEAQQRNITPLQAAMSDYLSIPIFTSGVQYHEDSSGTITYAPIDPETMNSGRYVVIAKNESPTVTTLTDAKLYTQFVEDTGDLSGSPEELAAHISIISENGMIGIQLHAEEMRDIYHANGGKNIYWWVFENKNLPNITAPDTGIIKGYNGTNTAITNDYPCTYSLISNFKTQDVVGFQKYKETHENDLSKKLHRDYLNWILQNP